MDQQTVNWIVGILATGVITMVGVFLRGLHTKIENAVSRDEFMKIIEALKREHESDRKELRDNQISIFTKLEVNNQLLTQVATKVEMLTQMRPFDQTWTGMKK